MADKWPPVHTDRPAIPAKSRYDLVVIGGGSAGITAARMAGQIGAAVLLVDAGKELGGDCTHTGCVPSKALIAAARTRHALTQQTRFGLPEVEAPWVDVHEVFDRIRAVQATIADGETPEILATQNIETILEARAAFAGDRTIDVNGLEVEFTKAIICTGSKPIMPNHVIDVAPLTHETIWNLQVVPEYLLIMGAGPVGVEMAQAWRRLGANVSLIMGRTGRLLPKDDAEVSGRLRRVLEAEGIEVVKGGRNPVVRGQSGIGRVQGDVTVVLPNSETRNGSHLLVAVGKAPHTDGLDLATAGIKPASGGGILVDDQLRTSNKHVFAAGDVLGDQLQLTHVAAMQAGMAVANAFTPPGLGKRTYNRDHMGWCTFSDPEVAQVGLNEDQARERWAEKVDVYRYDVALTDRALTDGDDIGYVKLVARKGRVVGATLMCARAGELIHQYAVAVRWNLKVEQLLETVSIYPTYAEATSWVAMEAYYDGHFSDKGRARIQKVMRLHGNTSIERLH